VELLSSREILTRAAATPYTYRADGKIVTAQLPVIYGIKAGDSVAKYDQAVQRLGSDVSAEKSRETGIVRVSVVQRSPELAQQVDARLLALLNEFNLKTRQSQAANERRFIEQRMSEISTELRGAENRLQDFLQRNRGGVGTIPELSLERDRLQREVSIRQQVYTSLSTNYEQARIDEVRDTPALTVIESPSYPAHPAPRGTIRRVFLAMIFGLVLGILPLIVRVLLGGHQKSLEEEREEFRQLRGKLRLWRPTRDANPPLSAREA
jgi:uncharacterized protein involved in exopolysaccharide biosynthesis